MAEPTHSSKLHLGITPLGCFKYRQIYLNTSTSIRIHKKLDKKTEKKKETKHTWKNEINAGEPIRTMNWHHSPFLYVIQKKFARCFWNPNCKKCNLRARQKKNSYLLSFVNFSCIKFKYAFASFSHTKHFQCFVLQ